MAGLAVLPLEDELGREALVATDEAPGAVFVPLALDRGAAPSER